MSHHDSSLKLINLKNYASKLIKRAPMHYIDNGQQDLIQKQRLENILTHKQIHYDLIQKSRKILPSLGYLNRVLHALKIPALNEEKRMLLLNAIEIILRFYDRTLYRNKIANGYTKAKQIQALLHHLNKEVIQAYVDYLASPIQNLELKNNFISLKNKIRILRESPTLNNMVQQEIIKGLDFEQSQDYSNFLHKITELTTPIIHINQQLKAYPQINAHINLPNCLPFSLAPLLFYKKDIHFGIKIGQISVENNDLIKSIVKAFEHDDLGSVNIEIIQDTTQSNCSKILVHLPLELACSAIVIRIDENKVCQISCQDDNNLNERQLHAIALAAKAIAEISGKSRFVLVINKTEEKHLKAAAQLCLACQSLDLEICFPCHLSDDHIEQIREYMSDSEYQRPYRFYEPFAFKYFKALNEPSLTAHTNQQNKYSAP